jgi:hypothetical protein
MLAVPLAVGGWRLQLRAILGRFRNSTAFVVATSLVGLIALGPATGSGGAAASRGLLLNTTTAHTVFKTLWPKFGLAYATGETKEIARYADADVQKAIMGWFYCGCGPWPTAYQHVNFTAPPQAQYPLSFLAEVQAKEYSTQADVIEVVYTKETEHSPWLIAYLVPYINGAPLLETTTMNTTAPKLPTPAAEVGNQLANYFQTVFNTGTPPNTWPQMGALQQEINRILTTREALSENRLTETIAYTAGTHSLDFANPQGDLMCGEIRAHSVVTSTIAGTPIVQPPDQSLFSPALSPGSYTSVTTDSLRDACWGVTPDGSTQPISFFGGNYSRIGVPAPPP